MTLSAGVGSPDDPDAAPAVLAVGRSVAGILLVLLGAGIILGALFLLFVAPFLGEAWAIWENFTDLFWIPLAIGLSVAIWGVSLARRTRRIRLEEPASPSPAPAAAPSEEIS